MVVYNVPQPERGGQGRANLPDPTIKRMHDLREDMVNLDAIQGAVNLVGNAVIGAVQKADQTEDQAALVRDQETLLEYEKQAAALDAELKATLTETDERGTPTVFDGVYTEESARALGATIQQQRRELLEAHLEKLETDKAKMRLREAVEPALAASDIELPNSMWEAAKQAHDRKTVLSVQDAFESRGSSIGSSMTAIATLEASTMYSEETRQRALDGIRGVLHQQVNSGLTSPDPVVMTDTLNALADGQFDGSLNQSQLSNLRTVAPQAAASLVNRTAATIEDAFSTATFPEGAIAQMATEIDKAYEAAEHWLPAVGAKRSIDSQRLDALSIAHEQARNEATGQRVQSNLGARYAAQASSNAALAAPTPGEAAAHAFDFALKTQGLRTEELGVVLQTLRDRNDSSLTIFNQNIDKLPTRAARDFVKSQARAELSGRAGRGAGRGTDSKMPLEPGNTSTAFVVQNLGESDKIRLDSFIQGAADGVIRRDDRKAFASMSQERQVFELLKAQFIFELEGKPGINEQEIERLAENMAIEVHDEALRTIVESLEADITEPGSLVSRGGSVLPSAEALIPMIVKSESATLRPEPLRGGRATRGGITDRDPNAYMAVQLQVMRLPELAHLRNSLRAAENLEGVEYERGFDAPELLDYSIVEEWGEGEDWGAEIVAWGVDENDNPVLLADENGEPVQFRVGKGALGVTKFVPAPGETMFETLAEPNSRDPRQMRTTRARRPLSVRQEHTPEGYAGKAVAGLFDSLVNFTPVQEFGLKDYPATDPRPDTAQFSVLAKDGFVRDQEAVRKFGELVKEGSIPIDKAWEYDKLLADYERAMDMKRTENAADLSDEDWSKFKEADKIVRAELKAAREKAREMKLVHLMQRAFWEGDEGWKRAQDVPAYEDMLAYFKFSGQELPDEPLTPADAINVLDVWLGTEEAEEWLMLSPGFRNEFRPLKWLENK